jgi:N utilization substance protein B
MTDQTQTVHESNDKAALANAAKRFARLAAVQALYQESFGQETLAEIVRRGQTEGMALFDDEDGQAPTAFDSELFALLAFGVADHRDQLHDIVKGALDARFSFDRMEILLRMILLAGVFELLHRAETPAPIIISDYVDVARAYFTAKEPGLVNAVLDRLAKTLRS